MRVTWPKGTKPTVVCCPQPLQPYPHLQPPKRAIVCGILQGYLKAGWFGAVLFLLVFGLSGCLPTNASWRLGLSTNQIQVVFPRPRGSQPPQAFVHQALVVVFQRAHTFIETGANSSRPVRHTLVRVLTPDKTGMVTAPLPLHIVAADLLFIAPGRLTDTLHWQRQLGLGDITYSPNMPLEPAWYHHFYTFLLPQLNVLLTEPRFNLSSAESLKLAEWIKTQTERFEAADTPQPTPFKK